jgi:hypothetical protein
MNPTYSSHSSGVYFGSSVHGGSAAGVYGSQGAGGGLAATAGLGVGGGFSTGNTQDFNGDGYSASIHVGPWSISATWGNGNFGGSVFFGGKSTIGGGMTIEATKTSNIKTWESEYGKNSSNCHQ